jgi:predicted dehydrogenase
MMNKVKIGLFGVGHLGKFHARLLQQIEGFELIGFYDPSDEAAETAQNSFGIPRFASAEALIEDADAIDIVCPTVAHFDIAHQAISLGKHVFIEKPLATNLSEAATLVQLVADKGVKAMVGHVERFNPAMLSLDVAGIQPLFIETHRLAQFNPRGTDVSVVHDLMIHDLDIILSLVKADIKNISASGVAIVSKSLDIANARIEFTNGCVANVTASRISLKNMRKMRIFQPGSYVSIDFLERKSDVVRIFDEPFSEEMPGMEIELGDATKKYLTFTSTEKKEANAILLELELFHKSITTGVAVPVSVSDGYRAMQLAQQIIEKIHPLAP